MGMLDDVGSSSTRLSRAAVCQALDHWRCSRCLLHATRAGAKEIPLGGR
jgi:hypothetical protein